MHFHACIQNLFCVPNPFSASHSSKKKQLKNTNENFQRISRYGWLFRLREFRVMILMGIFCRLYNGYARFGKCANWMYSMLLFCAFILAAFYITKITAKPKFIFQCSNMLVYRNVKFFTWLLLSNAFLFNNIYSNFVSLCFVCTHTHWFSFNINFVFDFHCN